jgi:hypothetical protein
VDADDGALGRLRLDRARQREDRLQCRGKLPASLLANLDIARSKYQEKINRLNLFLEYRDIPIALQKELALHIHADVLSEKTGQVYETLGESGFLGEVALLRQTPRRTR